MIRRATGIVCVVAWLPAAPQQPARTPAERLVAAVLDSRPRTGFSAEARLTHAPRNGPEVTRWLTIAARRDGPRTLALYHVVGPAPLAGQALLVEHRDTHAATATRFDAGGASAAGPADAFFDSHLTIEDVSETFWFWPSPAATGDTSVGERRCTTVEFRPPTDARTQYSRVAACIARDLNVPLRVELYGRRDQLEKRLIAGRLIHRNGRWMARRLIVESTRDSGRTEFEGTKYDARAVPPVAAFSSAAIQQLLLRKY